FVRLATLILPKSSCATNNNKNHDAQHHSCDEANDKVDAVVVCMQPAGDQANGRMDQLTNGGANVSGSG
ncbi:unnamed protein product, partial [Ceratitis capitata]